MKPTYPLGSQSSDGKSLPSYLTQISKAVSTNITGTSLKKQTTRTSAIMCSKTEDGIIRNLDTCYIGKSCTDKWIRMLSEKL
jgi:hypothetical protein